MSWNTTKYEQAMEAYLIEKLGKSEGHSVYVEYENLRNELIKDNFFNEIKGKAQSLSDHSERHIADVLDCAYKLIGNFGELGLSAYEVYCLALMILFHDVGNIFGREGHDSIDKIAQVYNQYKANFKNYSDERRLITLGASAHSGLSRNKCKDTLRYISESSIKGEKINLPELASILRFADELAEGKHRTCSFLIEKDGYEEKSKIFHEYAQVTQMQIDRPLGRIAITYTFNISDKFEKDLDEQQHLVKLLRFSYYRATKLDQERRYTKYYSSSLKVFNRVTVSYQFEKEYTPIDFDIKPIVFEDKYPVPGIDFVKDPEHAKEEMEKNHPDFILENIIKLLLKTQIEEV